jgi:arylsulfatase A-like enzyme
VTGVPKRPLGLGRCLLLGALIWGTGLVVYSGVEDAVNVVRGFPVPTATLGAIALVHAVLGAIAGAAAGVGAFVLTRLRRTAVSPAPLLMASVAVLPAFLLAAVDVNERYLPDLLTTKSLALNAGLLAVAVLVGLGLARHLAARRQPAAFLCLVVATSLFVSSATHLHTFYVPRMSTSGAVLAYVLLAGACALVYAVLALLLGAWRALPPARRGAVAGAGAAAALLALALPGAVSSLRPAQAAVSGRPNVVWLVLDTLRADHLSTYGYPLRTTPNLDAIGADGVVFEHAVSGSSWTIPSHFHMVTGSFAAGREKVLPDDVTTAAEILRERGYRTAAVLANQSLGRGSGFEQGFETFVDAPPLFLYQRLLGKTSIAEALANHRILSARTVQRLLYRKTFLQSARAEGDFINAHVFRWFDGYDGGPFFLFVNYLDPHEPYDPQEPYRSQFAADVDSEVGFIRYDRPQGKFISTEEMTRDVVPRTAPERWRQIVQLYDAEVAFVDAQVGAIVRELQRRNLYDNTILVITADHGELFGEHGLATHFKALTEEELHVPLIIRYPPGIAARTRIATPVELVDILPTVLDFVGGGIPPMDGRNLRPLIAGKPSPVNGETYSVLLRKPRRGFPHTAAGDLVALRTPQSKYVWSSTGKHSYYDLVADARELQNLFGDGRPPEATRSRVQEWRLAHGLDRPEGELDPLTRDRLKNLGYID